MCEVRRNECPCGHALTSYLGLREKQPTKTILRENGVESSTCGKYFHSIDSFNFRPYLLGSNPIETIRALNPFPEFNVSLTGFLRNAAQPRTNQMLAGGVEKVLQRRRDTAGCLYVHEKMADAGENSFFIPKFRFPM
ncbi:hypothetical protein FDECE_6657 [Fusarium decemcellulare]|nr:hypothetical protein FDECE_6657 [Fusarium decemcellulare]